MNHQGACDGGFMAKKTRMWGTSKLLSLSRVGMLTAGGRQDPTQGQVT